MTTGRINQVARETQHAETHLTITWRINGSRHVHVATTVALVRNQLAKAQHGCCADGHFMHRTTCEHPTEHREMRLGV